MTDLLPCPFCGTTGVTDDVGGTRALYFAGCDNDGCPVESSAISVNSYAEAITAWNTRTDPDHIAAIRLAREALAGMMDAWLDYHDAHSLTDPVTGRSSNAFDAALAARDHLDTLLQTKGDDRGEG